MSVNIFLVLLSMSGVMGLEPVCPSSDVALFERILQLENDVKTTRKILENILDKISGAPVLEANLPLTSAQQPLTVAELETQGWKMVFLAHSANGASVYSAWTSGAGVSNVKPVTMVRSHSSHYRDPGVDNWNSHNIKYVKFALYEELREVAYVIFNAAGSDNMNWFQASRVVASSWSDLTSSSLYNYFSILGHDLHKRRFFINRSYEGCPKDLGYLAVSERGGEVCSWDVHPVFPQFLYSRINTADYWERLNFGRADHLAIFVYL